MMQHSELIEASGLYNSMDFTYDGVELYGLDVYSDVGSFDFVPSFISTPENSSEISSQNQYFSPGLSDDSYGLQEIGKYFPNMEESVIISKERGVLDNSYGFEEFGKNLEESNKGVLDNSYGFQGFGKNFPNLEAPKMTSKERGILDDPYGFKEFGRNFSNLEKSNTTPKETLVLDDSYGFQEFGKNFSNSEKSNMTSKESGVLDVSYGYQEFGKNFPNSENYIITSKVISGVQANSYGFQEFGNCFPNSENSSISMEKGVLDEINSVSDLMEIETPVVPSHEVLSSIKDLVEIPSAQLSLIFPQEDIELDTLSSVCYLIKAYGESVESSHTDLVQAILKRFEEKADPTGETFQRLAFYFVQLAKNHMDYLRQESFKIYRPAFLAFYQIFPFGRVPHFFANSEILNSVSQNAEIVYIVDFDIGEGLQWPSLIESIGRRKHLRVVRFISIKWEEKNFGSSPSLWKFEETKRQLTEHAHAFGLNLEVEEMEMERLAREMKMVKKNGGNEFIAFNCMLNLPHMGRIRSKRHVNEFLKIAKDSEALVTFGDGLTEERKENFAGFGSFLERNLFHFYALLESMDSQLPPQLIEARIAMESLFVAPYFSSVSCLKRWEENGVGGNGLLAMGLEPRKLNKESVAESKELAREGESQFWVRNGAENGNEMVLGYMETPLVRVSSWK